MRLNQLPNQRPGEEVVLFLRRHWIDLVKIFLMTALLLIIPLLAGFVLSMTGASALSHPVFGPLLSSLFSAYLLIIVIVTLTELTDYWLDVWLVTNERIISSEQLGLFNRVVSEVHLDQIQDVTSETKGLIATFLTYGNVYVQTAAARERFEFKNIDNPDEVKIKISELTNVCKTKHHHPHAKTSEEGATPSAPTKTAH